MGYLLSYFYLITLWPHLLKCFIFCLISFSFSFSFYNLSYTSLFFLSILVLVYIQVYSRGLQAFCEEYNNFSSSFSFLLIINLKHYTCKLFTIHPLTFYLA
jgi:hypothetical protein